MRYAFARALLGLYDDGIGLDRELALDAQARARIIGPSGKRMNVSVESDLALAEAVNVWEREVLLSVAPDLIPAVRDGGQGGDGE